MTKKTFQQVQEKEEEVKLAANTNSEAKSSLGFTPFIHLMNLGFLALPEASLPDVLIYGHITLKYVWQERRTKERRTRRSTAV